LSRSRHKGRALSLLSLWSPFCLGLRVNCLRVNCIELLQCNYKLQEIQPAVGPHTVQFFEVQFFEVQFFEVQFFGVLFFDEHEEYDALVTRW